MYVPELDRELAVLSVAEAEALTAEEPGRWNVISVSTDPDQTPPLTGAQRLLRLAFDDVDGTWPEPGVVLATKGDVLQALQFARKATRQPLLIHCTAGISRSAALAWAVVYDRLNRRADAGSMALEIVRRVRPICAPNRHILRLSIALLAKRPLERERVLEELAAVL